MRRMIPQSLVNQIKKSIIPIVVSNIKQIPDEILSSLEAGDIVQKVDSSGKHSYVVSFKKDGTGICLTYTDASIVETQSYDYTDGHWVYNSEDKTEFANIGHTDEEVKALAKEEVESATAGTLVEVLGLDAQGGLVKGNASGGGSKLYLHKLFRRPQQGEGFYIFIISSRAEAYTFATLYEDKDKIAFLNGYTGIYNYSSTPTSVAIAASIFISSSAGMSITTYKSDLSGFDSHSHSILDSDTVIEL